MKNIIIIIAIFIKFMFVSNNFSQPHFNDIEFLVFNSSGSQIYIQFYPIGGVFSGFDIEHSTPTRYTLNSQFYTGGSSGINRIGSNVKIHNITGLDGYALTELTDHIGYFPIENNLRPR